MREFLFVMLTIGMGAAALAGCSGKSSTVDCSKTPDSIACRQNGTKSGDGG